MISRRNQVDGRQAEVGQELVRQAVGTTCLGGCVRGGRGGGKSGGSWASLGFKVAAVDDRAAPGQRLWWTGKWARRLPRDGKDPTAVSWHFPTGPGNPRPSEGYSVPRFRGLRHPASLPLVVSTLPMKYPAGPPSCPYLFPLRLLP